MPFHPSPVYVSGVIARRDRPRHSGVLSPVNHGELGGGLLLGQRGGADGPAPLHAEEVVKFRIKGVLGPMRQVEKTVA